MTIVKILVKINKNTMKAQHETLKSNTLNRKNHQSGKILIAFDTSRRTIPRYRTEIRKNYNLSMNCHIYYINLERYLSTMHR